MQKTIIGFIVLTSLFLIGYEYLGVDSQKKEAPKESTNKVAVGTITKLVFDDKNIIQEEEALFDTNDSKDRSLQNYKDHNRTAEKVTVKEKITKKKVVTSKLVSAKSDKNLLMPAQSAVLTDKEFEDVENWMINTGQIKKSGTESHFEDNLEQQEVAKVNSGSTEKAKDVTQPMISNEKYKDIENWMIKTGQISKQTNTHKEDVYKTNENENITLNQEISEGKYKDIENWMIKTGQIKTSTK
ncbi:MAG: hypothetical protein ACWA5P_02310 [bacterium]